ncbi:hypothetical protein [Litorilituus lipolyticus]|uniref:Uncharacterized protein n=1 Tax=Litorilituus lipolyticus TaxID=2491017 RepID=A0A502KWZ6_9GAMM|nr:hypothetical protein [Litorilituus lipolyticus]TPH15614.1 hypothetical protein EPA86_08530 [Litorilituus lipolyticus]
MFSKSVTMHMVKVKDVILGLFSVALLMVMLPIMLLLFISFTAIALVAVKMKKTMIKPNERMVYQAVKGKDYTTIS